MRTCRGIESGDRHACTYLSPALSKIVKLILVLIRNGEHLVSNINSVFGHGCDFVKGNDM